jgi:hypothetical protein
MVEYNIKDSFMNFDKLTSDDIQKMVKGEHSSQNKIQVSVSDDYKPTITRHVGDKWTDADGNEWEQKDGYALRLGKEWQQELQKELSSFANCPKETCTCDFPNRYDKKMKAIHGMCFDCVIAMEHKLRIQGKYEEYEREKIKSNALAWLAEAEKDKDILADTLSRLEFTNEFGDVEKWNTNFNKEELLEKITIEFENFKKMILEQLEDTNAE